MNFSRHEPQGLEAIQPPENHIFNLPNEVLELILGFAATRASTHISRVDSIQVCDCEWGIHVSDIALVCWRFSCIVEPLRFRQLRLSMPLRTLPWDNLDDCLEFAETKLRKYCSVLHIDLTRNPLAIYKAQREAHKADLLDSMPEPKNIVLWKPVEAKLKMSKLILSALTNVTCLVLHWSDISSDFDKGFEFYFQEAMRFGESRSFVKHNPNSLVFGLLIKKWLKNLRHIDIRDNTTGEQHGSTNLNKIQSAILTGLPANHLESISFRQCEKYPEGIDLIHSQILHHRKSLKRLCLVGTGAEWDPAGNLILPTGLTNLTHLELAFRPRASTMPQHAIRPTAHAVFGWKTVNRAILIPTLTTFTWNLLYSRTLQTFDTPEEAWLFIFIETVLEDKHKLQHIHVKYRPNYEIKPVLSFHYSRYPGRLRKDFVCPWERLVRIDTAVGKKHNLRHIRVEFAPERSEEPSSTGQHIGYMSLGVQLSYHYFGYLGRTGNEFVYPWDRLRRLADNAAMHGIKVSWAKETWSRVDYDRLVATAPSMA
ncbi:hypothetical protein BT63DRAFT_455455 [Microthyrium microscopicum]|uniref:Uncharacterized protein n=1 Tax=Microthyrium microscopicum TaxID=703497 RepID=A0A6A6UCW3_9PEZI|nr:hypothetical protein BT63DRAFT_455455 [Microthyrium microscopicum]